MSSRTLSALLGSGIAAGVRRALRSGRARPGDRSCSRPRRRVSSRWASHGTSREMPMRQAVTVDAVRREVWSAEV